MNVATFNTTKPELAALKLSALLAVDKGVQSTVSPIRGGFILTADDGLTVTFLKSTKTNQTTGR